LNFFNPYILFGLIAVAIPVLLHILNLQKVQKMEFSTLMFLKELQKSRFRRIRVKQWPLMLTRILIIVFLVLTFADFFIEGYSSGGKDITKLGLIFADSSYSMNIIDGQDSMMKTAAILQDKITGLYSSTDEVRIFHPGVDAKFDTSFTSQQLKPYLPGILMKSAEETEKFNYPVKEVFVISDFQKINFNYAGSGADDKTYYYFINSSVKNYPNISVNRLEAVTKIPEPSRPLTYRAVIKNHSANIITNAALVLNADGIKQEEKTVTLNPYERKEIYFTFNSKKTGFLRTDVIFNAQDGRLDALKEDNSYTEIIYIPDKINIGIISRNSVEAENIKSVFDAANRISGNGNVYDYRISGNIPDLNSYDVLYICGFDKFTTGETDEIKKYLSAGKGVFIFPAENIDFESYNRTGEFKLTEKIKPSAELSIAGLYSESPLFEGVFRDADRVIRESDFDKVKINGQYKITLSEKDINLIKMQNLLPLLIESRTGDGSLIMSAVSGGESMSDFSKHALFAPVILKSAGYLSYIKTIENRTTAYINHDTLESDLSRISESELNEVLKASGIKNFKIISGEKKFEEIKQIVEDNRKGKSYWLYTLIAVLLLTAFEIFLIKKVYKSSTVS